MSIKVMNHVWENSPHKGQRLLMILALADYSDDTGDSFAGIKRIAKKSRTGVRNAQKLLRQLHNDGSITIHDGQGVMTSFGPTNRYTVHTSWNPCPEQRGERLFTGGVNVCSPDEHTDTGGVNLSSLKRGGGVNTRTGNPSVYPSEESSDKVPFVEQEEIQEQEQDTPDSSTHQTLPTPTRTVRAVPKPEPKVKNPKTPLGGKKQTRQRESERPISRSSSLPAPRNVNQATPMPQNRAQTNLGALKADSTVSALEQLISSKGNYPITPEVKQLLTTRFDVGSTPIELYDKDERYRRWISEVVIAEYEKWAKSSGNKMRTDTIAQRVCNEQALWQWVADEGLIIVVEPPKEVMTRERLMKAYEYRRDVLKQSEAFLKAELERINREYPE